MQNKKIFLLGLAGFILLIGLALAKEQVNKEKDIFVSNKGTALIEKSNESKIEDIIYPEEDNQTFEDLMNAPKTLKIGIEEIYLNVALWRDYMPRPIPEGVEELPEVHPIMGTIEILNSNQVNISDSFVIERFWMIMDNKVVWETIPTVTEYENVRRISVGGGLKGGPKVDVIVRIIDKEGNKHLLKVRNQGIFTTA
jgi:predicted peroxiredoxin